MNSTNIDNLFMKDGITKTQEKIDFDEKYLSVKQYTNRCTNDDYIYLVNKEDPILYPSDLFDIIVENQEYMNFFIDELKHIINEVSNVLYSPPYRILFGRVNMKNLSKKAKRINELFYEGFELKLQ